MKEDSGEWRKSYLLGEAGFFASCGFGFEAMGYVASINLKIYGVASALFAIGLVSLAIAIVQYVRYALSD